MLYSQDLNTILGKFDIKGEFVKIKHFEKGHINETYIVKYNNDNTGKYYVHQRVNHKVFKNPKVLMENIKRVSDFIREKLIFHRVFDINRRVLTLIKTLKGDYYIEDSKKGIWRTYNYIDNSRSIDCVKDYYQAFNIGKAFGEFQQLLYDFPIGDLIETIPNFHNTVMRFDKLNEAIERDNMNRVRNVGNEIEFLTRRNNVIGKLIELQKTGGIPLRVVHNDTKCNNVLFDSITDEYLCVVDLDTVMPGLSLYDFGDMIRSASNPAKEDDMDLSKVDINLEVFRGLTKGYLDSAGVFLNNIEKENLVLSAKIISLELGARFLTDYLEGDVYFKTVREKQNLDRARVQLRFVELLEEKERELEKIVRDFLDNKD